MESNVKDKESAVVHDNEFIDKKIQAVPKPKINRTGMTDIGLATKVVNDAKTDDDRVNAQISTLDLSALNSFTNISTQRDKLYTILENMADDPTIAAALETYAEDATEPNADGKIVWAESDDSEVSKYINFLIESLQINKNIYKWAYSLCEYGDMYVETFRESEKDDDTITFEQKQKTLNEAINVNLYSVNDPLVHYVEMYPNPAELFELTKFGKTAGYIKTDITTMTKNFNNILNTSYQYKFKQGDINVYNANKFVHACLDDNSSRVPEKVELFKDDDSLKSNKGNEYTVKRGKALFYNVYKIWRMMSLLEDSMLLNRLTKSSILRLIEVEVGDMPKEDVISYLNNLKSTMEQKTALNVGNAMSEYNNPGPVINNVYIPTRGEQGKITTSEVGGDLQVSQLPDIEFFNNKFFGAIRIPKQFLGCLRGDTKILLLNGSTVAVKDMFDNKEKYIGKGIMACNKDGTLQPTIISNIMLTKPATDFIRVHLDNGEYVDVTNDHRMMLRDGTFVLAEDLNIGDSLMPYYDYVKSGRRYVLDNKLGKYLPQYRVVAESVCDIPKGYQVHHKDHIKINDDFDNLIPLTIAEHYNEHCAELHNANKQAYELKREQNIVSKFANSRIINNGIRQKWLYEGEELPRGYTYGTLKFTEEHCKHISDSLKGVPKNYDCVKNFGDDFAEKSKETRARRKANGEYVELYKKRSAICKMLAENHKGWHSPEAYEKRYARFPKNRLNTPHYVRCLCCGKVEEIKCNEDWYTDYLNKMVFWFCCKDCAELNGRGKLARSYRLFLECNSDGELYEQVRNDMNHRPDTYFKFNTLAQRLKYIENYEPRCNHKVIALEHLNVSEPAYDISVQADCHTFALPCGIFVHNCTDDATGFNGGTSLTIISSRYAKTIKRIQAVLSQLVTDIITIFLLDKQQESYLGKFTIKMQAPVTQEDIDRKDNDVNKIATIRDTLDLLDIQTPSKKLEIAKDLLASIINNPEVLDLLEEEIENLKKQDTPTEEVETLETPSERDSHPLGLDRELGLGRRPDFETTSIESEVEEPTEETETSLPTPEELGIGDLTDNTSEE